MTFKEIETMSNEINAILDREILADRIYDAMTTCEKCGSREDVGYDDDSECWLCANCLEIRCDECDSTNCVTQENDGYLCADCLEKFSIDV